MFRTPFVTLVSGLVASLVGCGSEPQTPQPLRIAAASDLQSVMPVLTARFKRDTGIEVEVVHGSSGRFARQIRAGAPFDLFLSANQAYVDELSQSGLIRPDSVKTYTKGSLVLVVNRELDPGINTPTDLVGSKVKAIAIANPEVAPYGAAAKAMLERIGLWEQVKSKVVPAETVRQALQFVQTGNAEVGLVGRAIADVSEVRILPVDPRFDEPILQAMGIPVDTKRSRDAERFAAFLRSDVGQRMLVEFGFRPLGPIP